MTLPKLLGFLKVHPNKDKSVDSKPKVSTPNVTPGYIHAHVQEDGHLRLGELNFSACTQMQKREHGGISLRVTDVDMSTLKNLDEFIGENIRTISRASTARSGGLTARSVNSATISRPISKVLREIEAIPCNMDDAYPASMKKHECRSCFHAIPYNMETSVLKDDEKKQPQTLHTSLSDVEKSINDNARTISDTLTARSGNLTSRSIHSACSSRPITKLLRDIDAF
jgi:hypothetical protein